jgi:diguanylate cyclase (GGDEF)-like protein
MWQAIKKQQRRNSPLFQNTIKRVENCIPSFSQNALSKYIRKTCSKFNHFIWWAVIVFLLIVIGTVDHITGYELSFSLFYLAPVSIAAWHLSKPLAMLTCILSALTWFTVDFISVHSYSHMVIPYWNAILRLGIFIIVAGLIFNTRKLLLTMQVLATQDGLTGLQNARAFRQSCVSVFELANRHRHTLAIGYIDLDGFKLVNDTLGHTVGDEVLQGVAGVLAGRLRKSDVGARLGGDEFVILLSETTLQGASTFFSELHNSLQSYAAEQHWNIGFSVGIAVFTAPTINSDEAIRQADELMYQVKRSGKNNLSLKEFIPAS